MVPRQIGITDISPRPLPRYCNRNRLKLLQRVIITSSSFDEIMNATLRNLGRYLADKNNSFDSRESSNGRIRFDKNNHVRAESEWRNCKTIGSMNNSLAGIIWKRREETSGKVARSLDANRGSLAYLIYLQTSSGTKYDPKWRRMMMIRHVHKGRPAEFSPRVAQQIERYRLLHTQI